MKLFHLKPALCLASALALTACASNSPTPESTMRLYSPSVLFLKQGQEIKTADGVYIVQKDEIWHSHSEYMSRVYEGLSK